MQNRISHHEEPATIQRDWHDLKPGDVVFFGDGWHEVADACLIGKNTLRLKLRINIHGRHYTETHRVHLWPGHKATCKA